MTEDKMAGWHHRFREHEFEQTLGDSKGRGIVACRSPQSHRVRHDFGTEQRRGSSA